MIVTVTLNPAVDRVIVLCELHVGDTNRVTDGQIDPGGKGVNVSRVLAEIGGQSLATGFLAGSLGDLIEKSLRDAGIPVDFIRIPGQSRQNLAIVETCNQRHTLLNEAGPATDPLYLHRLERELRRRVHPGDWVVMAGSVPPHLPLTVYAELIDLVHQAGAKAVLDADGEPLRAGIAAKPELIKPNREELERLVGRPLTTDAEILAAARRLQKRGITYVVVSMGRRGSIGVGPDGAWLAIPPAVTTVSAVGAGDSLVAGLVLALSQGESLAEGMRLGSAAGAATALRPGTRLARAEDFQRLLPLTRVEPLVLQAAA
ncbi:MAG TPA: 1-phosphofructokinase [Chloroflexota bacterium]|nr:1-phosphofructokinase [Chloroflexota bacterium]